VREPKRRKERWNELDSLMVIIGVFVVGLALLIKGSDLFVEAATAVAEGFGVSEFFIALVLASVATTLPELTVSTISAYNGNSDIALGNALGSALANIALILGLSSMIMPLDVDEVAWQNSLFLLGILGYSGLLMWDGVISRLDGLTLVVLYVLFLYYMYKKHMSLEELESEDRGSVAKETVILFLSGLIVIAGAKLVVNSAVELAKAAGISQAVIGLTIVSIGTSLPELTNSLTAVMKKLPNISVGNMIGADIIDILLVIGVSAIIKPIRVSGKMFHVALPLTLLSVLILTASLKNNNRVGRKTGAIFLGIYALFLYLLQS
jgi:cation:H+ antiporter